MGASPVRRSDTAGYGKSKQQTTARMHQRVRERLPHLPALVEAAERHRATQQALLAAARQTPVGEVFIHDGCHWRRVERRVYARGTHRAGVPDRVWTRDDATGREVDLTAAEDDAFWAWAVLETLRHTGVRAEELVEITHLALVSYRLPDTGEVVPMLQIVPSKTNAERLLLIGPELASVLATIVTRLRDHNGGAVPLTARYDPYERELGAPLPHLFQRRHDWRWRVPSHTHIQKLLADTAVRADLRDASGQPLRCTPHDYRRMFATEAVAGGLPVHIAARILGHDDITTTQAYTAVFDEDLVRAYRSFLDRRRATRPEAEYREPTAQEWRDFQQHFRTRKIELDECARPYGTPCKHEHACIRCPSLRLDPRARPRLVEIIANLRDRIQEARLNGWHGEVQGLQASLDEAARKLASLDRLLDRSTRQGPVSLNMSVITNDPAG